MLALLSCESPVSIFRILLNFSRLYYIQISIGAEILQLIQCWYMYFIKCHVRSFFYLIGKPSWKREFLQSWNILIIKKPLSILEACQHLCQNLANNGTWRKCTLWTYFKKSLLSKNGPNFLISKSYKISTKSFEEFIWLQKYFTEFNQLHYEILQMWSHYGSFNNYLYEHVKVGSRSVNCLCL